MPPPADLWNKSSHSGLFMAPETRDAKLTPGSLESLNRIAAANDKRLPELSQRLLEIKQGLPAELPLPR